MNNKGYDVFMILAALFSGSEAHSKGPDGVPVPFLSSYQKDGEARYRLAFAQRTFTSDSLEDLSETAMREVDKFVRDRVDKTPRPYIKLDVPASGIAYQSLFLTSPDNPKQIELYVDSFRKGIALYRASRKIQGDA